MERQELEARLADQEVLNTLSRIHRDLQRPIPNWVENKREYGHEKHQSTQVMRNWISVYDSEYKRKGIDNQHETFEDLQNRNSDRYEGIVTGILNAVNGKFILV